MRGRLRDKKWYPYAVAACIAVAFYVLLVHLGSITDGILTFLGYFKPIFSACVFAYILNPLAKMFSRNVFLRVSQEKIRWRLSIGAAVIMLLMMLAFLLRILIPQLANSMGMLIGNLDSYAVSLNDFLTKWKLADLLGISSIADSSEEIARQIQNYFTQNAGTLVNASAAAGRSIAAWVIALILSIYILASKDGLKKGTLQLLSTLIPERRYNDIIRFLSRCDRILVNYIISTLIDSVIVGLANGIFMSVMGMEYVGLISVLVAVTNLVPTFGPIVGGAIGGIILLLVKPVHALIFIIFTFVLQFIDPYFIKPRLFGNSLGVSGLLILVSVIACGRMFGVIGILISIPLAAIFNFVYQEALLPALERRAAGRRKYSDGSHPE